MVSAVAVSGTTVYIGGGFTNVAGIATADYVAKWNGSTWSALGSNGAVALAKILVAAVDPTIEGKTQSDLVVGAPCIARNHPDFQALRLANLIFGRLADLMGQSDWKSDPRFATHVARGQHQEMLDALKARDSKRMRKIMMQHVHNKRDVVVQLLKSEMPIEKIEAVKT